MTTVANVYLFLCFAAAFLAGGVMARCESGEVKTCLAFAQQPTGDICIGRLAKGMGEASVSNAAKLQKCAEELTCTDADDYNDNQFYTEQLIIRGFADAAKFICDGNAANYSAVFPCLNAKGYNPANILDEVLIIEECIFYKNFVDNVRNSAAVAACGPSAGLLYAKVATRIANPLVAMTFADDSCKYYI
jgi:hypothetical protein